MMYREWVLAEAARVLDEIDEPCVAKMIRGVKVPVIDGGAKFLVGRQLAESEVIMIERPRHYQVPPDLKDNEVLLVHP